MMMEEARLDNNPLKKYFEKNLRVYEAKGKIYCQILTDVYGMDEWRNEPVGPKRGLYEYLHARQVILIYVAVSGSGKLSPPTASSPGKKRVSGNNSEYILAMGMTAWEYCWNDKSTTSTVPSRAYIQYVDTTGMYRPRRAQGYLTRAVVSTYLRYCQECLRVTYVHLYASAKPSLLFAGSELLPKKRSLDCLKLLNWWLALVHTTWIERRRDDSIISTNTSPSYFPEGYCYFPAEELFPNVALTLRSNLQALDRSGLGTGGIRWFYNLPFVADDEQSAIPLFEDDPKWKHYEAAYDTNEDDRPAKRQRKETSKTTIRDFFQTMAYRSEFRQEPSAFFILKFPENENHFSANNNNNNIITSPYSNNTKKGEAAAAFACKLLKTLTFSSEIEALQSSMKTWSWLKLIGAMPLEIECDTENTPPVDLFSIIVNNLSRPSDISFCPVPLQNDIQSLIKRKIVYKP